MYLLRESPPTPPLVITGGTKRVFAVQLPKRSSLFLLFFSSITSLSKSRELLPTAAAISSSIRNARGKPTPPPAPPLQWDYGEMAALLSLIRGNGTVQQTIRTRHPKPLTKLSVLRGVAVAGALSIFWSHLSPLCCHSRTNKHATRKME